MARVGLLVVAVIAALTASGGARAAALRDAEHAATLRQEPTWNTDHWEQDKPYYTAWAHLHFCVAQVSPVKDLDSLRAALMDNFEPTVGEGTLWELAQEASSTWTAPTSQDALLDDLVWPYSRERLSDAQVLCVEGTDDGCCCKGRGTWKVYARFETLQEARSLWGGLRQPESWDKENLCIGAAAGGVREETAIEGGHIVRVPLPAEAAADEEDEGLSTFHIWAFALGFGGVFAMAIWLTCVFATTKAMWNRFVLEPLRRYYETKQLIRIETAVTFQAAKLRDDLQSLYNRAVYGNGRDPLAETDDEDDFPFEEEEMQLLNNNSDIPIMHSPAGKALARSAQNSPSRV